MKCEPGCSCGRHKSQACFPGCTCRRHLANSEYAGSEAGLERKREQNRQYARKRRLEDPDAVQKDRERNQQHGRRYHLKSKYGITPERWDEMFTAQEECCYLCSEPLVKGSIHLDHDHACCRGKKSCGTCIRGLACQKCNQGIGQFGDDPERMRRVADNLEMATAVLRNPAQFGIQTPAGLDQQGSNTPC